MPLVGINSRYCYKEHILSDMAPRSVYSNACVNYDWKEGEARVKAVIFRVVVVWVLALCSKFV
jgi:hypothetical protein